MTSTETLLHLNPRSILPNPYQPRKDFDEEALKSLTNSIKENGILQPPTAALVDGKYYIIAGERRLRAAQNLEMETIPVVVRPLNQGFDLAVLGLLENLQREDLSPIEVAEGYSVLTSKYGFTQQELATKMGKARSSVANTLRLNSAPEEVKDALREKKITEAHALTVLSLSDETLQERLLSRILSQNLNVRQTQEYASMLARGEEDTPENPLVQNPYTERLRAYSDKSKFVPGVHGGGQITLSFKDNEALDAFMQLLGE